MNKNKLKLARNKVDQLDQKILILVKKRTKIVKHMLSLKRFKKQIVDQKRNKVNGSVKLKLYKGNITIVSRQTKSNAYSMKKVSFEENKTFNKSNVERFINFHKKNLK